MYAKVILAFAATATATNWMAHPQAKRDLLQARATGVDMGNLSSECTSAVMGLYTSMPTPPPEIIKDASQNPQTDPCDFTTPASLSSQYASYESQISSWFSKNEGAISSAIKECPALSQYATMLPICETGVAKVEATQTSQTTGTAGAAAASSTGTAGASRAGMSAAALAAAGLLVVAL